MGGHVLIVDSDPARRTGLGADLGAIGLALSQGSDPARLLPAVAAGRPDLVVLDLGDDPRGSLAALAQLRARPGRVPPVLALVPPEREDLRLAALRGGADDAAPRGTAARLLQARVRSLLRLGESADIDDRADGDLVLPGLSEPAAPFAGPGAGRAAAPRHALPTARIALLAAPGSPSPALAPLGGLLAPRAAIGPLDPDSFAAPRPDLVILDGGPLRGDLAEGARVLAQLADLRGHPATRESATLVLLPASAPETAALALDLGAGDVVTGPATPEEIAHRAQTLLARRAQAERRQAQVRSRLRAAVIDPLTGLANLREANPALRRMAEEAEAEGQGVAVLMIDIDHFKSINDRLGHAAGDCVLAQVARRLRLALRGNDLLARVGGEEFRAALPDVTLAQARRIADSLRQSVAAQPFRLDDRRGPAPAQGGPVPIGTPFDRPREDRPALLRVTVSIGVAAASAQDLAAGLRPADLIDRADAALYAAKAAGRNRVETAIDA